MKGLDTVDRKDWPPVPVVFWAFRIMVGMGLLMLTLAAFSLRAPRAQAPLRLAAAAPLRARDGTGRLRCCHRRVGDDGSRAPALHGAWPPADSRSRRRALDAPAVGASLVAFVVVYFFTFGAGTYYILEAACPIRRIAARRGPGATSRCGPRASRLAAAVSESLATGKEA